MSSSPLTQRKFRLVVCIAALLLCQALLCSSSLSGQSIAKPLLFTGNTTVIAPPTADTEYAFGPRDFGALYRRADCTVEGIIATAKHFVCNDQETDRTTVSADA